MNLATAEILEKQEYREKLAILLEAVHAIKPGMTRHHVERLLPTHHGGVHRDQMTVYHESPGFQIVVPFNDVGFPGASSNQVNGQPTIHVRHITHPGTQEAIVTWEEIA